MQSISTNTNSIFKDLKFRWPWRIYQERVLSAIDTHISDRRLHIVAAPGAGKTTLGLEIFRQLGQPALALSPTRTIRDQWILRLNDFIPPYETNGTEPDWVSRDLETPAIFTSITYQALHTTYRRLIAEQPDEENIEDELELLQEKLSGSEIQNLIDRLKIAGIKTLILDEAHHLRAEWWKALTRVLEDLPDVVLVALTATPPYDVTGHEWNRYQELCGPIDEEVSVPELVKAGTLCPHQDYVYAVQPSEKDRNALQLYNRAVKQITDDLLADKIFYRCVRLHPWIANPEIDAGEIIADPEMAAALLVYLKAREVDLPKHLLRLLAVREQDIPRINRRWWQVIVKAYLFDKNWQRPEKYQQHRDDLATLLRKESILYRQELSLDESRKVKAQLSLTATKIDACQEIYWLERKVRGDDLRMVVLTDFIRDDNFVDGTGPKNPELGAWPIFHRLASTAGKEEAAHIGLLTGRLAIVHTDRLPALEAELPPETLSHTPLAGLPGFCQITVSGTRRLTGAFTELLTQGELHALVGTRALLGEGWDAPVINSLVLASFVGSFMLTNQMRGRAIRIDRSHPDKAASIWHIVAIDVVQPNGIDDYIDMKRRFGTFVGLSENQPIIESGLERLHLRALESMKPSMILPDQPLGISAGVIERNNKEMVRRLADIGSIGPRWQEAIDTADEGRVIPSVLTPKPPSMRAMYFTKTLRYLLTEIAISFMAVFSQFIANGEAYRDLGVCLTIVTIGAVLGFLVVLPRLIRATIVLIRHLPVDGSLRAIGKAVRDALHDQGLLETDHFRLKVITEEGESGEYFIMLAGGTFREQSLFADCMGEVLGEIGNPRYLITREGKKLGTKRRDYHAVPQILGINKERAESLLTSWHHWVGPADLLYTRVPEGRALLLKARAAAFSTIMERRSERRDQWQ